MKTLIAILAGLLLGSSAALHAAERKVNRALKKAAEKEDAK